MYSWVEAADWIVWQLTGNDVRNACTAATKGIRQDGPYPAVDFLAELNPDFADFVATKLDQLTGELGSAAGTLTAQAARWTGVPEGIAVAVGKVDAHVTAAAALLATVKAMGAGTDRGTSFTEDYTYHFGPGEPKILGAHMLEVCPTIAVDTPSCDIHPLGIGDREDPVRLVFDAAPGAAVVIGIADLGDRFRLVANTVEVVPPDEPVPNLPVARAVWKPAPSLPTSTECWLTAGGPHHTVLTQAVSLDALHDLAEMLDTELAVIDADTTPHTFGERLRWNRAFYRLAGGLGGVQLA